ncbi:MAG: hypothetical protein OEY14_10160 [Myxococcales bacterium]|nr:hypothetical protein [Myxococcales bacterium]
MTQQPANPSGVPDARADSYIDLHEARRRTRKAARIVSAFLDAPAAALLHPIAAAFAVHALMQHLQERCGDPFDWAQAKPRQLVRALQAGGLLNPTQEEWLLPSLAIFFQWVPSEECVDPLAARRLAAELFELRWQLTGEVRRVLLGAA